MNSMKLFMTTMRKLLICSVKVSLILHELCNIYISLRSVYDFKVWKLFLFILSDKTLTYMQESTLPVESSSTKINLSFFLMYSILSNHDILNSQEFSSAVMYHMVEKLLSFNGNLSSHYLGTLKWFKVSEIFNRYSGTKNNFSLLYTRLKASLDYCKSLKKLQSEEKAI